MSGAFFTGLAGLVANAKGIETVGNNLANSNTVGFKMNNIFFQELISASNQLQKLGQGVQIADIRETFSQGGIQSSQVPTDMAIQGSGFFVVGDGITSQFYTRAGNFLVNNDGTLMTTEGFFVLGYPSVNGVIDRTVDLVPLNISAATSLEPQATSIMQFEGNLNSDLLVGEVFTTAITVFDSLGDNHQVTFQFTRTAAGWDYELQIPALDTGGLDTDPPIVVDSGSLTFDGQGRIATPAADVTGITLSGLANGADDLVIDWQLFDSDGNGVVTQFKLQSQVSDSFQNGNSAGILSSIVVRRDGVIEGLFTNGEASPVGQIALAKFVNPQGLVKVSGNTYSRTFASGDPTIGEPETGGRGLIRGNSLESSNVDIAEEFVKLIIFQRAYQANSRLVTTADEVVQEAIALKR